MRGEHLSHTTAGTAPTCAHGQRTWSNCRKHRRSFLLGIAQVGCEGKKHCAWSGEVSGCWQSSCKTRDCSWFWGSCSELRWVQPFSCGLQQLRPHGRAGLKSRSGAGQAAAKMGLLREKTLSLSLHCRKILPWRQLAVCDSIKKNQAKRVKPSLVWQRLAEGMHRHREPAGDGVLGLVLTGLSSDAG